MEKLTLDFLPELKDVLKFRMSYTRKETINFNETDISVISFEDWIKDKQIGARPKDLKDIKQLLSKKNQK